MFSQARIFLLMQNLPWTKPFLRLRGQRSFYLHYIYGEHWQWLKLRDFLVWFIFRIIFPLSLNSNEDSQSVPSPWEPQVETPSFLSPGDGVWVHPAGVTKLSGWNVVYWMFTSLHELSSAEKMACCRGVSEEIVHSPPDVTDLWSSAVPLNQSDCTPYGIFSLSEADTFSCFLEEPDQVCSISKKHTL